MSYFVLTEDWQPPHSRDLIKAGAVLFPWRLGGQPDPGTLKLCAVPEGQGHSLSVPASLVQESPPAQWEQFELLIRYFMQGTEVPPNLTLGTPETLDTDLSSFAHLGCLMGIGHAAMAGGRIKLPSMERHGEMAVAALAATQGGHLTGEATVLIYRPVWDKAWPHPRTAKFKICDHDIKTGAGARPHRGWHPSQCDKCGLNTSVDSGD